MYRGRLLNRSESFNKSLEKSLIKHADTIQYLRIEWEPVIKGFLSYFVNLLSLEIYLPIFINRNDSENILLPNLKTLKTRVISLKILANIIKNTKGNLSEISIGYNDNYCKMLIQAIYQNCPKLKYLHLTLHGNSNSLILEIENLLIYCQVLNGLVINVNEDHLDKFNWHKLFQILTKSSPNSLFKFKFFTTMIFKLDEMKFFFDNWKDRNPMLIRISNGNQFYFRIEEVRNLIEEYKEKGIIKNYSINNGIISCENFEWV
ncbi:hypothetical protein RclHR1_24440003 [Rhizophagus clarus]|uniref:F-box domain-containing protein n=1 Tax=Rhizophagus clarus TaxID=94130 RepID=A0A2Z6RAN2_9GLOM|nr:hypothetical protein RclHR1_24440003 [Rhizophagus clarus]GES99176.1 hypothetical protein GLOIN_2v1789114 [Rhizophagus clarus]